MYFENINNIAFFCEKLFLSYIHIYDRNCKNKTFKILYKFIFYNTKRNSICIFICMFLNVKMFIINIKRLLLLIL